MFQLFLGATVLCLATEVIYQLRKTPVDQDQQALNDFFKLTGFCNKKEEPEFAFVKWVQNNENYKVFGIAIPVGCDVNVLLRMKYALENLFTNDVEIFYDNQNYRIKVYKGKLKKAFSLCLAHRIIRALRAE